MGTPIWLTVFTWSRTGVPFDVAFSLPVDERLAWVVAMGRFDGLDYDWSAQLWKKA